MASAGEFKANELRAFLVEETEDRSTQSESIPESSIGVSVAPKRKNDDAVELKCETDLKRRKAAGAYSPDH